jgi:2-polyprenyl-3-methyl-5-hydroxy-6-metoxy-1,4-benzoquinol methylase
MENTSRKTHWENVYQTRQLTEVSWYQPVPETSLSFIAEANLPKDARIIDIGGGDSFLVDHLLKLGYTNISVLDISASAIERAKERLGDKSNSVTWIVSDISEFNPEIKYDLWHDRAAFHFLTDENDITRYTTMISNSIRQGGTLVLGTFSEQGPKKCSGLEIRQYSESSMAAMLQSTFRKTKCLTLDHSTPFNTVQNFTFCSFIRA